MLKLTFLIDAPADFFTSWLQEYTRNVVGQTFPTEKGNFSLNQARPAYRPGYIGTKTSCITMAGYYITNSNGEATAYPLSELISFKIIPLTPTRTEVVAECQPAVKRYFLKLLENIDQRWPQSQDFHKNLTELLGKLEESVETGFNDLKQGQAALYKRIDSTHQDALAQIEEAIRTGRMNQGEILRVLDAIRRALRIMLSVAAQLPPEMQDSIARANRAVESPLGMQQMLELTLPIIPTFLSYKVEVAAGTNFNLSAAIEEVKELWESFAIKENE